MIQFLQQVIEDCDGAAPVSVLFAGFKAYTPMVLYAVDEIGIVASDEQRPGRKKAYPWTAVTAVRPEIE